MSRVTAHLLLSLIIKCFMALGDGFLENAGSKEFGELGRKERVEEVSGEVS